MGRLPTALLLATALVAGTLVATAGTASADTYTVSWQAGTYYFVEDADTDLPRFTESITLTCFADICVRCPNCMPTSLGGAETTVGVWIEDNGCEGLQKQGGDCDGDQTWDPADEKVAHREQTVRP